MTKQFGFHLEQEHKDALESIGRYLVANVIADVEDEKRTGAISHSAVLRFLIDDYSAKTRKANGDHE